MTSTSAYAHLHAHAHAHVHVHAHAHPHAHPHAHTHLAAAPTSNPKHPQHLSAPAPAPASVSGDAHAHAHIPYHQHSTTTTTTSCVPRGSSIYHSPAPSTTTSPDVNTAAPLHLAAISAAHFYRRTSRRLRSTPPPPPPPASVPTATTYCYPPRSPLSPSAIATPPAHVDKVERQQRPPAPSNPKVHSRLASFGRQRLRGIVPSLKHDALPQGETQPRAPVSPSDSSSHKPSDASTRSNTSSETALSDDSKSDIKSLHEDPRPSVHHTAGWLDQEKEFDSARDLDEYERLLRRSPRKMHQTSSKLLRLTDDDRPYDKDFKDLFATLVVSLPLTPHRVRFSRVDHTFTSEEAITNLGSLKFSQSNRMPDPKDVTRIVTTTTTTTFSMAKEMARQICMRYVEARFIESVDGKSDFSSRSAVWQLTPKGMHILARFCQRNGIHQRHINELLDSPKNMMQLVILERDNNTDQISHDSATIEVLFRRFAGETGPNMKTNSSTSESDSMSDYVTGLVGVKMQRAGKRGDKDAPYIFTGMHAFNWLMDCCTTVDRREAYELANLFISSGLIETYEDRHHGGSQNGQVAGSRFSASKSVYYGITHKGLRVAGWAMTANGSVNGEATVASRAPPGMMRDSNTNRMTLIIQDAALRLLFREYLRETHCEENLAFFLEVKAFLAEYGRAKRGSPIKPDIIRETLASAYSLYNAFLAPGSPCELNIDHNLRNALAGRMTRAVGEDEQMIKSLDEVAVLFDQAQNSVFKLMASDSVPKFFREPKYAASIRERNLESLLAQSSIS